MSNKSDPGRSSSPLSPFEITLAGADINSAPITDAASVIGTPTSDAGYWPGQQHGQDTCAIRCQEFIIQEYTGTPVSEASLVHEAAANGWYQPGSGTSGEDVGKLLENHGIAVHRYQNANIFQLSNELAQGHKVIVGVNSEELWDSKKPDCSHLLDKILDTLGYEKADHAVVVSGIDTSDPNHVQVIVSDPGTGEVAARYPLNDFVDAWKDSKFYMVATDQPVPQTSPAMAHFDYSAGHLPQVWNLPYDQFAQLADQPLLWEIALDSALTGQQFTPMAEMPSDFSISGAEDAIDLYHPADFSDPAADHVVSDHDNPFHDGADDADASSGHTPFTDP